MEATAKKRYFIQTFGCQMNVNDSEKVAGLLEAARLRGGAARRATRTSSSSTPARCARRPRRSSSSRSRAWAGSGRTQPELRIGVGGCVAQLEGEPLLDGAPQVDVLVGTHNLAPHSRAASSESAATGRSRVDLDRGADAFDVPDARHGPRQPGARLRDRDGGLQPRLQLLRRAAHARPRGEPARRPRSSPRSSAVVARGFPEVMLLGQTVNAYRIGRARLRRAARAAWTRSRACGGCASRRRTRATSTARMADALPRPAARLPVPPPARPVGLGPRARLDAPRLHARAVPARRSRCCATASRTSRSRATSSSAIPARRRPSSRTRCRSSRTSGFDGLFSFAYSPRPGTTARAAARTTCPRPRRSAACTSLNEHQQQWQRRRNEALVGTRDEVLVEADRRRGPRLRPHAALPDRPSRRTRDARWARRCASRSRAAGPELAPGRDFRN